MKGCCLIVDGSNFLFRAYHALPPLTNSKGQPTGAIRGMITMLNKLMTLFNPEYVAITFDHKGENFRHALYPQYKANRPPMPEELRLQIEPLYQIIQNMGLRIVIEANIEADDTIATLATQAHAQNLQVIIASSDKDLAQLVNDNISLFDGMKNQHLDRQAVFNKYGVYPEQIRDYLALTGDKSDNIPGIEGVGAVTAAKWLHQYQTLDQLIANADKITGKIGEKFRQHQATLALSKELTTLVTNAPLNTTLSDLIPQEPDYQQLIHHYDVLEFKQLLTILKQSLQNKSAPNIPTNIPKHFSSSERFEAPTIPQKTIYQTIQTSTELKQCLANLCDAAMLSIHIEVDHLDPMEANLLAISLCAASGTAFYIPIQPHDTTDLFQNSLTLSEIVTALTPIFSQAFPIKLLHNAKNQCHILERHHLRVHTSFHDPMLMAHLLYSEHTSVSLSALATHYLGRDYPTCETIFGKGAKKKHINELDATIAETFCCQQADLTLQIYRALAPQLAAIPALQHLYENIEQPLLYLLQHIENTGILVNRDYLIQLHHELEQRITTLSEQIYACAGMVFNINSSQQLAEVLFDKLQLPVLKKTPKGKPSTAEEVLQELALSYQLPQLIIQQRELAKLNSTYTLSLVAQINTHTQRIHTIYHQALTSTGRLSSSHPNLQNIPIKTSEGRRIRQAFISQSDHYLVAADYSQIELRLMAHFSQDSALLQAFQNEQDIHRITAAEVFGCAPDAVTAEQRRAAKAINFGLIYGMSAFGLARQLNITRDQAQQYIARYFQRYPAVLDYMENIKAQAHQQGYVETLIGRRLYLPEINHSSHHIRSSNERTAINAPLQGTAADIIKLAMLNVQSALNEAGLHSQILLQVHDELVLEVPTSELSTIKTLLETQMVNVYPLSVPLAIHIGVGQNWDDAH